MAGCYHNPEKMNGKCPPKSVAKEFSTLREVKREVNKTAKEKRRFF